MKSGVLFSITIHVFSLNNEEITDAVYVCNSETQNTVLQLIDHCQLQYIPSCVQCISSLPGCVKRLIVQKQLERNDIQNYQILDLKLLFKDLVRASVQGIKWVQVLCFVILALIELVSSKLPIFSYILGGSVRRVVKLFRNFYSWMQD